MKKFFTTEMVADIHLSNIQKDELRKALNRHHLGVEDCNMVDENGRTIARFPEKETPEFKQSHYNVTCICKVKLVLEFDEHANLVNCTAKM